MKKSSTSKFESNEIQFSEFITERFASTKAKFKPSNHLYAKHIIGLDTWKVLDKSFRHSLGAAIFEMVNKNQLPLTYAGKNGANWLTYHLK